MNTLQALKLSKFDTNHKATMSSIASSISKLNNDLAAALSHQAYALKNPDLMIDESYTTLMTEGMTELIEQFAVMQAKHNDLLPVDNGGLSADDIVAKYSIDLVKYSIDLSKQK